MPPDRDRVLRRARVLGALGHRGMLEAERDRDGAERLRRTIRAWLAREGLDPELEAHERAALEAPIGSLAPADALTASWRFEGAAVLAWALALYDLPPHDRAADVGALSSALGLGRSDPGTVPRLRSGRELDRGRERAFAVHWRLVEHRLRPGTIDLATFARTAWFGPLEIASTMLADGDLAIAGAPIARADPRALALATSIAIERHQAFNWLNGDDPIYSEVDVST